MNGIEFNPPHALTGEGLGTETTMNPRKIVFLVLTFSFFLFSLVGCSAMKNIIGRVNFWDSDKTKANLTDKDVARFVFNVRSNRGNPDSHYLLACYYQERGKHKEAIGEFKKVLLIDPNYVKAYNGLGVSYDLLGDFPRAIESYKNALKLNPNLDYVQNNLGYSYLLQENFDGAIVAFKNAIQLNDKDKRFHNNLGLAYAEKGQFDLALSEFKLAADEAKAHYNMAQVYYKKSLYNVAMAHYGAAFTLDPFLTSGRTALEAVSALSRVFHPDVKSAKPEELATPENPGPKAIEELAAVEVKTEKSIAKDELFNPGDQAELETANAPATTFLPTTKAAEPPSPLSSPPDEGRGKGEAKLNSVVPDFYEVQVSSFRSKEKADLTGNSLRKSGYRTTVKYWKDDKGGEWYRLFAGPFMTKDEALTRKVRIEKEYKFGSMIVQSKGVKTQAEEVVVHSAGKSSLNSMRDVEIEISNGNGVNRMARRVGDYLKGKGLKVVRLTNADNFNYSGTRIYYHKGYNEQADYIAGQLPVLQNKEEIIKFERAGIKIKVLIGEDLVSQDEVFDNKYRRLAKKEG